MKYIHRHMEDTVLRCSATWPALLLTGPRQAGKTTLLRQLAAREGKGRSYISLDDLGARDMAKNDPAMFLQLHKPPLLIDEVQYAPELFPFIKMHVDAQHNSGDFWLTGSQIFRLMRGVQESLAGRVALLHLSPLSQRELCGAPAMPLKLDFEFLLEESRKVQALSVPEVYTRLWQGSMPALAGGHVPDRSLYYASYLASYVERDVRELSGAIDALKFSRFVTSAAARVGQLVNFKAMAEDANIREATAKDWLNILETLGIVFLLHPYTNNVLKRTIKSPKLYFYDTGLVCHLTRWSSPEVAENGAMSGALLENFAVSEIVKGFQNLGQEPFLHYYRDRDNKEIDVLLERDGALYPVEIKKTTHPDRRIARGFKVIDKSPLQRGSGAVLCLAGEFSAIDHENCIIPVWLL